MKKIILSSASPRRKELLEQIGVKFDIIVSDIDENIDGDMDPTEIVKKLALMKAENVYDLEGNQDAIVIGADTIVVHEGRVIGKPADEKDAFKILSSLSGNINYVYTGVAVVSSESVINFYEETKVYMKNMTEQDIYEYIKTSEPMDKAGAYGIQGIGAVFVEKIEGDYNNVVGLPLARLYDVMKELDENLIKWN
ncbi:septum formation protein [Peptoclostridium litorale DSM 5388]|uniref:dTTP/UTP pyrophosphatase n=1 Tax=Peptoclostridium litorale DSM 5388 TaxID=1121324 RepID=A0A069RBA1_PEPLI|nr:Maf family protein [Peptoclostridium litorale]KDR94058.1 septum formation protein Maf [Peptoclostridium litorale DSM 5388]SIN80275.1 septum formation protein [Peptoclostridium litorale DSM 5388]